MAKQKHHQWPCRNTINGHAEVPSMAMQKHHQWPCRNIINGRAETSSMAMQKHHQWPCRNTTNDQAETPSMAVQKHHQWPCRSTINGRAETSSMAVQKHHQWPCRNIINGHAADTLNACGQEAIEFVTPGQVPVIEGYCPLYAQQKKKSQWEYPHEVGDSRMVCFMGFLHVEITSQECVGKLLAGSGWGRMFS